MLFLVFSLFIFGSFVKSFCQVYKFKLIFKQEVSIQYYPIIGYIYIFLKSAIKYGDQLEYFRVLAKEQPNLKAIITNHVFTPYIIFLQPDQFKDITQNHDKFSKQEIVHESITLKLGLLSSRGEKWKNQRQILQKSFTFEGLKNRIPIIKKIANNKISQVDLSEQDLNLNHLYCEMTGQVVISTFFGDIKELNEKFQGKSIPTWINDQVFALFKFINGAYFAKFKFFLIGKYGWKYLCFSNEDKIYQNEMEFREFLKQIVKRRIQEYQQNPEKYKDSNLFLDIYITYFLGKNQSISPIQTQEIAEQFLGIFQAGTDTTAHLLTIATYHAAKDIELQKLLRQEAIQATQGNENNYEHETLSKQKTLMNFFNECLRVYTPVLTIFPRIADSNITVSNFPVSKGTIIMPFFAFSMFNEKYFPNAREFDITRWNSGQIKDTFSFIPFSAGGRNCIGQHLSIIEAKIFFTYILMNYELKLKDKAPPKYVLGLMYEFNDNNLVDFIKIRK